MAAWTVPGSEEVHSVAETRSVDGGGQCSDLRRNKAWECHKASVIETMVGLRLPPRGQWRHIRKRGTTPKQCFCTETRLCSKLE